MSKSQDKRIQSQEDWNSVKESTPPENTDQLFEIRGLATFQDGEFHLIKTFGWKDKSQRVEIDLCDFCGADLVNEKHFHSCLYGAFEVGK